MRGVRLVAVGNVGDEFIIRGDEAAGRLVRSNIQQKKYRTAPAGLQAAEDEGRGRRGHLPQGPQALGSQKTQL